MPRDAGELILTPAHWTLSVGWRLGTALSVLAGLTLAMQWPGLGRMEAVTVSFLTLAFGKLGFVFNLSEPGSKLKALARERNVDIVLAYDGMEMTLR